MKKFKKNRYSSVFYCYVVAVIIISIIISILVSRFCYSVISENSISAERIFENFYKVAEEKIGVYEKVSNLLFENEYVRNYSSQTSNDIYNIAQITKAIQSHLNIYKEVDQQIVITDMKSRIAACYNGSISLEEIIEEFGFGREELSQILSDDAQTRTVFFDKKTDMITFVFRRSYINGEMIYCLVRFSSSNITGDSALTIKQAEEVDLKNIKYTSLLSDNNYQKSSYYFPNLLYCLNIENNNTYIVFFALTVIMACIATVLLSGKIADKLLGFTYKPIVGTISGMESRTGEKKSWDESLDKIIEANAAMEMEIRSNSKFFQKLVLRNLVYGSENLEKIIDGNREKNFDFLNSENPCRIIVVKCGGEEDCYNKSEYVAENGFSSDLERLFYQSLNGKFVEISAGEFAFITFDIDKKFLSENLVKILDFGEIYGIEMFIAVGVVSKNIMKVNKSYRSACSIIEQRAIFKEKSILFSEELNEVAGIYYYPINMEISLIENTLYGNMESVKKLLGELFKLNLQVYFVDRDNLLNLKMMIRGTINRIINQMNRTEAEIFDEEDFYRVLDTDCTNQEMEEVVFNIFEKLCYCCANNNVSKQEKLAKDIMNFIEENYRRKEFSLVEVAKEFFISQGHVSRLLKSSVGVGYKEYIDNIRMKEAKRLLKETMLPVNSVSEHVGCTSPRTFIRLFRKYTNSTPSEYRLSNQKN